MLDLLDRLQNALAGRYIIEREIGHGGMAVVYLARDVRHERIVALKVLRERFSDALGAERFLQEIRMAARLHHPHLLPLYDSGEADGLLYYVSPYVEGGSLRERIAREGRFPLAEALRLAREVADALSYAHRQGVIHRDIKPANVLLEEGHAVVADFGVARAVTAAAESGLTQTGILIGTPAYMSPEQADDAPVDGRSDIYALGCVLYEMLAGRTPFTATKPLALLTLRLTESAPPLGSAGVAAPAGVEQVVATTLARRPEERYQTAADLAAALIVAEREAVSGAITSQVAHPGTRVPALAVLPFVNMSADPDNEFFSDGMTEELINALTQVDGLRVTSRTSAFAFKGKGLDVREIGQRLNVGVVLEGSVRRSGNRLRVSAQLINVADGYHLWSETYDRQLADVFEVQDDLSRSIVETLRPRLTGETSGPLVLPPTASLDAYTAYLKGRFFWNKRTLEGHRKGIEYFQLALSKDPDYALAYAGLADCWGLLGFDYFGGVPPHEGMPKAKAAALKALELDGSLAEAHSALGAVTMLYDWNWNAAEEHLSHALGLRPEYVPALNFHSLLLSARGRLDESLAMVRRAAEVEPLVLVVHQNLARSLHYAGRHEESVEQCRRLLDMDPAYVAAYETLAKSLCCLGRYDEAEAAAIEGVARSDRWTLLLGALGFVYGQRGKRSEAMGVVAELEEQARHQYVPRYHSAMVYYGLRDEHGAMRELERSLEERSGCIAWLGVDPQCTWLAPNPRYQEIIRDLGLYQAPLATTTEARG